MRGETPEGTRIYAYLAVRADRLEEFTEWQKSGTFYPADFGIIIADGEGDPPEDVRQMMTREYGFNHEAMLDIGGPDQVRQISKVGQSLYALPSPSVPEVKSSEQPLATTFGAQAPAEVRSELRATAFPDHELILENFSGMCNAVPGES